MRLLSKLFGSDEVIDAGMSAIDKAVFTEEEKADYKIKFAGVKVDLLEAYKPFKLAQRLLALIVGIPFVIIHVIIFLIQICLLLFAINYGSETYDFAMTQLDLMVQRNNQTLGEPFAWIVGFYFFGGAGEGIAKKLRGIKK
jgi:hypothetical protein